MLLNNFHESLSVPGYGVPNADIRHLHRNTHFEERMLTPCEVVIALVLYADTLLSINQIVQFFEAVHDTVHTTIREVEAVFERSFHLV